jgi:hypothetical protein
MHSALLRPSAGRVGRNSITSTTTTTAASPSHAATGNQQRTITTSRRHSTSSLPDHVRMMNIAAHKQAHPNNRPPHQPSTHANHKRHGSTTSIVSSSSSSSPSMASSLSSSPNPFTTQHRRMSSDATWGGLVGEVSPLLSLAEPRYVVFMKAQHGAGESTEFQRYYTHEEALEKCQTHQRRSPAHAFWVEERPYTIDTLSVLDS